MTLDYTGKDLLESANTGCHCHALCTRYTVYNGMHAYAAKVNSERHYIHTLTHLHIGSHLQNNH